MGKTLYQTYTGIEKTYNVCGGSACVVRTRIPVSSLVEYKRLGLTDEALLDAFPTLIQQDLVHAWAYYAANKKEIDQDIFENNQD